MSEELSYYQRNKERLKQVGREYHYKHRTERIEYSRQYYKTHREKLNERRQMRNATHPSKTRDRANLNAENKTILLEERRKVCQTIQLSPPEPPPQKPLWYPKPEDFTVKFD